MPLAETGQQVIEELRSRGIVVAHEGVGYTAQCPLHGDQMATLMIRQLSGGLLVHCRGGCPAHRVLKELKIGTRASTRRSD